MRSQTREKCMLHQKLINKHWPHHKSTSGWLRNGEYTAWRELFWRREQWINIQKHWNLLKNETFLTEHRRTLQMILAVILPQYLEWQLQKNGLKYNTRPRFWSNLCWKKCVLQKAFYGIINLNLFKSKALTGKLITEQ